MDTVDLQSRKELFQERYQEAVKNLEGLGYKSNRYKIIPISAFKGWNLIHNKDCIQELDFYDGETLLEAMDNIEKDKPETDKPLRIIVESIHNKVSGTNTVLA